MKRQHKFVVHRLVDLVSLAQPLYRYTQALHQDPVPKQ
jgi:hypothetical protein